MKTIVKIALAVMLTGSVLFTCGRAAGGKLYGSYYNGGIHPIGEAVKDSANYLRNHIRFRHFDDDDGWFDVRWNLWDKWGLRQPLLKDYIHDEIDSAFDDAWDNAESAIDNALGSVDDALDDVGDAVDDVDNSLAGLSELESGSICEMDINLENASVTFEPGNRFGVHADPEGMPTDPTVRSLVEDGRWNLDISCPYGEEDGYDSEIIVTIPRRAIFDRIWITALNCETDIDTTLTSQELYVIAEDRTEFDAELLNIQRGDFSSSGESLFSAELEGQENDYAFKCKASSGNIELNDRTLLRTPSDGVDTKAGGGERILHLNASGGTIRLETKH